MLFWYRSLIGRPRISEEGLVAFCALAGTTFWWWSRCCCIPHIIARDDEDLRDQVPLLRRTFFVHPIAVLGGMLETLVLAGSKLSSLNVVGGGFAQHIDLNDGGCCAINWWRQDVGNGPIALIFPGLANSSETGFVRRLCRQLSDAGFDAGIVDYRGCGISARGSLELRQVMHSLESWKDVATILKMCGTEREIVAIGHSMGGAILLNYLGKTQCTRLAAAVTVSAPIDVEGNDRHRSFFAQLVITTGVKLLLMCSGAFRASVWSGNTSLFDVIAATDTDRIAQATICTILGYDTPTDYARANSPLDSLHQIQVPTLMLHARNDPIVPHEVALAKLLPSSVPANLAAVLTPCGGHLAFIDVWGCNWADKISLGFLSAHLHRREPSRGLSSTSEEGRSSKRLRRAPSFRGALLGF